MPNNETASEEIRICTNDGWVRLLTELDINWIIEKVREALTDASKQ